MSPVKPLLRSQLITNKRTMQSPSETDNIGTTSNHYRHAWKTPCGNSPSLRSEKYPSSTCHTGKWTRILSCLESNDAANRHDAHESLQHIHHSRDKLAQRMTTPWWYKLGAALAIFAGFAGIGLVTEGPGTATYESAGNLAVILGAIIIPALLLAVLKRTSGVVTDRYVKDARWWYALVFGLLIAALVLQSYAGVPYALIFAGVLAFVATLFRERHVDTLQRRRLTEPGMGGAANG